MSTIAIRASSPGSRAFMESLRDENIDLDNLVEGFERVKDGITCENASELLTAVKKQPKARKRYHMFYVFLQHKPFRKAIVHTNKIGMLIAALKTNNDRIINDVLYGITNSRSLQARDVTAIQALSTHHEIFGITTISDTTRKLLNDYAALMIAGRDLELNEYARLEDFC